MSEEALRSEMVRACRTMSARGLSTGTSGNVSARVPGGMLITPSAVPYDRLRPEQIVWMRLDGTAALGEARPSTEWRMHAAILEARPDVDAVVHAHPMFCTTLACLGREIPAFHYMVALAGGDSIRCAPYATFGTPELARHALDALEGRRACLLANHGMVALAGSPAAALELAGEVEQLAAQYWRTLQVGEPRVLTADEMAEVHARFREYRPATPERGARRPRPDDDAAPRRGEPTPASADAVAVAGAGAGGAAAAGGAAGEAGAGAPGPGPRRRGERIDWAEIGQRWVGRVGALLLLLGLAYLMKFAVDQGWLGPPLRVAFGIATGVALLGAGLRLEAGRRVYALTLLGTGLATLYLTGYAAYALYGFLGPRTAFVALAVTTALALILARRREEEVLAQVGAAGAFAAPLLLGEAGGATALALYVIGVTGWTGSLAFLHGWRSLFGTILLGAFGLLFLANVKSGGAVAVGIAAVIAWGVVALLPLLRERLRPDPDDARRRRVPELLRAALPDPALLDHMVAALLPPVATLLLVAFQAALWELDRSAAAAVGFAAAAAIALVLTGRAGAGVDRARTVGAAPLLLVLLGAAFLVPDHALRIAILAALGVAAFLAPWIRSAPAADIIGHVTFALIAAWIAAQLSDVRRPPGFLTPLALAELAAIAAAVAVALRALGGAERRVFLLAAHLAILVWVAASARGVEGGLAWVSVLWGVYGAGLMVLAVSRTLPPVRLAALATLGLVAAKLLLVDTAGVGAGWRIILFLGFGAAFLGLGYLSAAETRRPHD